MKPPQDNTSGFKGPPLCSFDQESSDKRRNPEFRTSCTNNTSPTVVVPLKVMDYGASGDLIMMYPKPYPIYLIRGTITSVMVQRCTEASVSWGFLKEPSKRPWNTSGPVLAKMRVSHHWGALPTQRPRKNSC